MPTIRGGAEVGIARDDDDSGAAPTPEVPTTPRRAFQTFFLLASLRCFAALFLFALACCLLVCCCSAWVLFTPFLPPGGPPPDPWTLPP